MGRCKRLTGERLRSRGDAARGTEAVVGAAVLNCMLDAARPNSVRRSAAPLASDASTLPATVSGDRGLDQSRRIHRRRAPEVAHCPEVIVHQVASIPIRTHHNDCLPYPLRPSRPTIDWHQAQRFPRFRAGRRAATMALCQLHHLAHECGVRWREAVAI